TKTGPPWQVILGLDIPAAAGRFLSTAMLGAIAGLIKDRDSGIPMKGMITFPGSDVPGVVSDELGSYLARLAPGDYKIHIYANGYRWIERKIQVKPGKDEKWDLTLKRKLGTVAGKVFDAATGLPVAATLSFVGSSLPAPGAGTGPGEFATQLPPGKYKLRAAAPGYDPKDIDLTIRDRDSQTADFALRPAGMAAAGPVVAAGHTGRPTAAAPEPAVRPERPRQPAPAPSPEPARTQPTPKPAAAAAAKPAAAKLSAAEVSALYKTGVEQFMNEEYDKALGTFQKVLKNDPGNAKAKEYMGKTRDRLKKLKG
ncbi:MAG: carboxypeptidase regulatory-like domain-containing protein, partial [Candidatus Edwardsbacteria bacterium]|nr:carboxypeptidase regulatory-like domain-containing protein [Candidatus Edwardsbacteria bacterium]